MPDTVAIVGCGVSGITSAKQALDYGFEPVIFEQRDVVGGIWNYDSNKNIRTVSYSTNNLNSKEMDCFSDFPSNEKYSQFMHHSEMIDYLNSYIDHFKLRKFIKFSHKVVNITRTENWKETGQWIVTFIDSEGNEKSENYGAVLVCTGMHSVPNRPFEYRMENEFSGNISHSSEIKTMEQFHNKTIVLVGFGNSTVELATNLANIAKQVYISTRRGSWLLPLLTNTSKPWDFQYITRFNYYLCKIIPKFLQNYFIEMNLNEKFDHVSSGIQPDYHFLQTNVTFSKNGFEELLINQKIKIIPNLLSFTNDGIELIDKTIIENIDEVIFCTGYSFDLKIVENGKLIFIRENDFHLYKHMFLPELEEISKHSNFAVIGHIQPIGPFLPVVEMQARFFFDILSEKYELKSPFLMKSSLEKKRCQLSVEYIKTRRHTQIEDYTEYMDNLALKIGAKPSLLKLFKVNPILGFKCLFGPNLPYQYRIEGEHVYEDAKNAILTSEDRMYPLGKNGYIKSWQLIIIFFVVLNLWLLFW